MKMSSDIGKLEEIKSSRKDFPDHVIDLAERRIAAGSRPHSVKKCEHKSMLYSDSTRSIWCEDCERSIDAFDAFCIMVKDFMRMTWDINAKMRKADEALKSTIITRAAKALDKAWRGNVKAVPCPHCRGGLLPEDFSEASFGFTSREIELKRRENALSESTKTSWR